MMIDLNEIKNRVYRIHALVLFFLYFHLRNFPKITLVPWSFLKCDALWDLVHLYNWKNVKNTHGGALLLVKLQAKPPTLPKLTLPHGCFSRFFNCTNGTKSRNAPQISCLEIYWEVRRRIKVSVGWFVFERIVPLGYITYFKRKKDVQRMSCIEHVGAVFFAQLSFVAL